MSGDSEIVYTKEIPVTDVNDDSYITDSIDMVPFERASGSYHTPEFLHQVSEIEVQHGQDVKQELADVYDTNDPQCFEEVPLDQESNDSNTPELNYPLVEVKHENSEYVKRECDDEYEAEDLQHSVRV